MQTHKRIMEVSYVIKYDIETDSYHGYVPSMKPVSFHAKSEQEVTELIRDGVQLYLEEHPETALMFRKMEVEF